MGGACSTDMEDDKFIQDLGRRTWRQETALI